MKSNASAVAALLLLAGTGAERAFAHTLQERPGAGYPIPGAAPAPARTPAPAPRQAAPRLDYTAPEADPTTGIEGPRGSSQRAPGEQRYDEVGYAAVEDPTSGVTGVHATLPVDTLVEVTSLENGRTIVVLVNATDPSAARPITLSAGAARALGQDGAATIPVRVRKVAPGPGDLLALRSGQPAAARPDTPPILLNALRKHLGARPAEPAPAAAEPARPAPVRTASARPAPVARAPRPAADGKFFVQVAALSNARNAQALAQRLGGSVKQGGGLYRVQLGPFATRAQADAARGGAARAGYGDARVLAVN